MKSFDIRRGPMQSLQISRAPCNVVVVVSDAMAANRVVQSFNHVLLAHEKLALPGLSWIDFPEV
jgi:hypothetical protein